MLAAPVLQSLLDLYREAPVTRHRHSDLLPRVLALREVMTTYDAAYVALAEGLGAEFLTFDGALARVVEGQTRVRLVGARGR